MSDLPDVRTQLMRLFAALDRAVFPPSLSECLAEIPFESWPSSDEAQAGLGILLSVPNDAALRHWALEVASRRELQVMRLALAQVFEQIQTASETSREFLRVAQAVMTAPSLLHIVTIGLELLRDQAGE